MVDVHQVEWDTFFGIVRASLSKAGVASWHYNMRCCSATMFDFQYAQDFLAACVANYGA